MAKNNNTDDSAAKTTDSPKSETPKAESPAYSPPPSIPAAKTRTLPTRVVYLGPTMSEDGVLFTYGQTFNNGLPEAWAAKAVIEPEFMRLLTPIEKVNTAMAELRNPKSALSRMSQKVLAAHKARATAAKGDK